MKKAALVAAVLLTAVAAAGASAAGGPVVMDCSSLASAPSELTIACGDGNFILTKMHWLNWGKPAATGTGDVSANDCNPYCAAGHFHDYAVVATADRLQTCLGGRRQYSRLRLRYPGNAPATVRNTATVPLGCSLYERLGPQLTARTTGANTVLTGSAWQRADGYVKGMKCAQKVDISSDGKTFASAPVNKNFGFEVTWKAPQSGRVVVAEQECNSAAFGPRLFEAAVAVTAR